MSFFMDWIGIPDEDQLRREAEEQARVAANKAAKDAEEMRIFTEDQRQVGRESAAAFTREQRKDTLTSQRKADYTKAAQQKAVDTEGRTQAYLESRKAKTAMVTAEERRTKGGRGSRTARKGGLLLGLGARYPKMQRGA